MSNVVAVVVVVAATAAGMMNHETFRSDMLRGSKKKRAQSELKTGTASRQHMIRKLASCGDKHMCTHAVRQSVNTARLTMIGS